MAATAISDLEDILKVRYPDKFVQSVLLKKNPFLGRVKKDESMGGFSTRVSLQYAPTSGGSSTFATAQANVNASKYEAFAVTERADYSLFQITTRAIRAGRGDKNTVMTAMEAEVNGALNQINRSLGISMFRNGGGARGQVGSTSTVTLTLKKKSDVYNFEVGMYLDTDTTDGTSGTVDGGSKRITGISRTAGTLTTAGADWTSAGHFSNDDYIFREGDFGASLIGLDGWLPASVTGTTFFGVDRTMDAERLGGYRYSATVAKDGTIERTLINASIELTRMGGSPDEIFMNPLDFRILINEIAAKETHFKEVKAVGSSGPLGNVGYQALKIFGENGEMSVFADRNCPRGVCYMLSMDSWTLLTMGPIGFLDEDGVGKILRVGTADAYEGRIGAFGNLVCNRPGDNCRIDLSALPEVAATIND